MQPIQAKKLFREVFIEHTFPNFGSRQVNHKFANVSRLASAIVFSHVVNYFN